MYEVRPLNIKSCQSIKLLFFMEVLYCVESVPCFQALNDKPKSKLSGQIV